jgi:hypothetical protein
LALVRSISAGSRKRLASVNYTPGQLRDAVGIGQETYRHWKKALAPLRRDAGHSPCFTAGDLLAAAIVKTFVANYGMRVSALSALAGGGLCQTKFYTAI